MARAKPQRTCLGCRQVKDQDELIRFVRSPEGEVLVDYRRRLPGRGAYACPDRSCLERILARRQFQRAFRQECAKIELEALFEAIAGALRTRLENLLAMARKSGCALAGSQAVQAALERPQTPAAVILAENVSAGVAGKIKHKARSRDVTCLTLFDKAGLGRIMGRAECSTCALAETPLTGAFLEEWQRYCRILGEN